MPLAFDPHCPPSHPAAITWSGTEKSARDKACNDNQGMMAPRIAAVGDLIALPILVDLKGNPLDLVEMADNRPVLLVMAPRDRIEQHRARRSLSSSSGAIASRNAAAFLVLPDFPEAGADDGAEAPFPTVVDRGGRFAVTLGLVPQRERARTETVTLVFNALSVVTAVEHGDSVPSIRDAIARLPTSSIC